MTDVFDDLDAQMAATTGKATIPGGVDAFSTLDAPPPPPDKYRAAAEEEYGRLTKGRAPGSFTDPTPTGYAARAVRGAGAGWADDIAAGAMVPFEMMKRGVNPAEAYRYTRARETLNQEKTDENTKGIGGTLAEVAGALATGAGVLGSGTRARALAVPYLNKTIPAGAVNYASNVGKAAGLGAATGAGEAKTVDEMAERAAIGGLFGGAVGAVLPVAVKSLSGIAGAAQLPRLRNADNVAVEQVAEVARNAGVTPDQLVSRIRDASASGQPFNVADALGHEGQRKLTAMAKVPGPQRDQIVETLMGRNLNMPQRVGDQMALGMNAPGTAQAATRALQTEASNAARPLYRQAEGVTTWSPRLQEFWDHPDVQTGLQQGIRMQRRDAVGTGRPFDPHDYGITGFNEAGDAVISGVPNVRSIQAAKEGIDRMIEAQTDAVTGRLTKEGRSLLDLQRRMLAEVDSINPTYREARRAYAGPMQVSSAVQTGREMATRGRAADTVPAFEAMSPTAQQGARIGYTDQVLTPLEKSGNYPGILREKSLKGSQELDAMSLFQGPNQPGAPSQLRQRLNREETMLGTSNKALGGSSSIENAADVAAAPGGAQALGLASSAMSGNPVGFARNALDMIQRYGKGESEAQRVAITRQLLESNPDAVQTMAARIAEHEARRRGVNPWQNRAPRFAE